MLSFVDETTFIKAIMYRTSWSYLVFPVSIGKLCFSEEVDKELRDICLEIARRYEINFLEIGLIGDHAHFWSNRADV